MRDATRIHLPTDMTLDEWKTVGGCVLRVLLDSNRTEDIITAEELGAQSQIAYLATCGVMSTGEGPDIMRDRPDLGEVDQEALRRLPASTLGGAFARFFADNGLTTEISGLRTEMASMKVDIIKWNLATILVVAGLMMAMIRL